MKIPAYLKKKGKPEGWTYLQPFTLIEKDGKWGPYLSLICIIEDGKGGGTIDFFISSARRLEALVKVGAIHVSGDEIEPGAPFLARFENGRPVELKGAHHG